MFVLMATQSARAQTLTVLHQFSGQDGEAPSAGLTMDAAGNFYGTTYLGGQFNYGTVFKLKHAGSSWILAPLFAFDGPHGANPQARVVFEPDGRLYGTTARGGQKTCDYQGVNGVGCGVLFSLRPSAAACKSALCPWTQTVIHYFQDNPDGGIPGYGDVIFDQAGSLYGTTSHGGSDGGCVYEFTPENGGWTESILQRFPGGPDGLLSYGGPVFDSAGNLYGTTEEGGLGYGVIWQLVNSGSGWQYNKLYVFDDTNGADSTAGLIQDAAGNFYGATSRGGMYHAGTTFMLNSSGGEWNYNVIYGFAGVYPDEGPLNPLLMDAQGNLYGTTYSGGLYAAGSVFKLTPSEGGWVYTSLHDFTGTGSDAGYPQGSLVMDADGNLYGTASMGGQGCGGVGCGLIFEITP